MHYRTYHICIFPYPVSKVAQRLRHKPSWCKVWSFSSHKNVFFRNG